MKYLLDENDVINDNKKDGYVDDIYAIDYTISQINKSKKIIPNLYNNTYKQFSWIFLETDITEIKKLNLTSLRSKLQRESQKYYSKLLTSDVFKIFEQFHRAFLFMLDSKEFLVFHDIIYKSIDNYFRIPQKYKIVNEYSLVRILHIYQNTFNYISLNLISHKEFSSIVNDYNNIFSHLHFHFDNSYWIFTNYQKFVAYQGFSSGLSNHIKYTNLAIGNSIEKCIFVIFYLIGSIVDGSTKDKLSEEQILDQIDGQQIQIKSNKMVYRVIEINNSLVIMKHEKTEEKAYNSQG